MTRSQMLIEEARKDRRPRIRDHGTIESLTKNSDTGIKPEPQNEAIVWGNLPIAPDDETD